MTNEPNLSNSPNKVSLSDTGLAFTILKKEDSKIYDKHELSDKSLPEFFTTDWEPLVTNDGTLYHSSRDEYEQELLTEEKKKIDKAIKETHDNDMKFFYKIMSIIGAIFVLLVLTTIIIVRNR